MYTVSVMLPIISISGRGSVSRAYISQPCPTPRTHREPTRARVDRHRGRLGWCSWQTENAISGE